MLGPGPFPVGSYQHAWGPSGTFHEQGQWLLIRGDPNDWLENSVKAAG